MAKILVQPGRAMISPIEIAAPIRMPDQAAPWT